MMRRFYARELLPSDILALITEVKRLEDKIDYMRLKIEAANLELYEFKARSKRKGPSE